LMRQREKKRRHHHGYLLPEQQKKTQKKPEEEKRGAESIELIWIRTNFQQWNTKQLEQQEADHSDGYMEKETKMRSSKRACLFITSQVILAQTLRTENFTYLCALAYIRRRRSTPPPPPPCVQLCERETPQIGKGIANNCEEE
jgi:hypothetical protein